MKRSRGNVECTDITTSEHVEVEECFHDMDGKMNHGGNEDDPSGVFEGGSKRKNGEKWKTIIGTCRCS